MSKYLDQLFSLYWMSYLLPEVREKGNTSGTLLGFLH